MIDNTRFFVPCKAVQKLRLSVSFNKYRKSIWLDFRQQSFSACRFTVVTVRMLFLNGTFSILVPIFIRTIVGAAAAAMVVFRAKATRQATSCNSKFSFHACPPSNSVFLHPPHIQKRIQQRLVPVLYFVKFHHGSRYTANPSQIPQARKPFLMAIRLVAACAGAHSITTLFCSCRARSISRSVSADA